MKTEQQPQYKDYINLIRKEAWKRIQYNPLVDFEELVSQGNLAFTKALETWDPAKGKFSTHLTWQCKDFMGRVQGCRNYQYRIRDIIDNKMVSLDQPYHNEKMKTLTNSKETNQLSYNGQTQAYNISSLDEEIDALKLQVADEGPSPFEQTAFRAALAGMSREALEVAVLVLTVPWELVDWTLRCVRPTQGALRQYLRSLGWGHPQIDSAFAEIKSALAEL